MDSLAAVPPEDPGRRTSNFPAVALVMAIPVILLTVFAWHSTHRPDQPAWNHGQITARFVDYTVRKEHENVHLFLRYDLTNNTRKAWSMPPPNLGTLMRRLPDGALHELDSVQWDPVKIPAGKTGEVSFDLLVDLTREDTPPGELQQAETLHAFADRHLRHIEGLLFLDYSTHDSIDLPKGWSSQPPPQQINPE